MLRSKNPGFSANLPLDLLEVFSTGYIVTDGEQDVSSDIPREVAELDKRLGIAVIPT